MGLFRRSARHAPTPTPPHPSSASHATPIDDTGAPDFNALVNLTRHDPARLADLWNATFHLPAWHFLVTDAELARTQGRPPSVLQCRIENRPFMVAFTSEAIAASCASANPELFHQTPNPLFQLPTQEAALYVAQHITSEIFGIVFNQTKGHLGFYAPLTNILPMYNRAHRVLPPGTTPELLARAFDFDPLLRRARTSSDPTTKDSILRTLASLDAWSFLTTHDAPHLPMTWTIENNQTVLMAFTDDRQLARMAQLALKQSFRGPFNALHLARPDIPPLLHHMIQGGTTSIAFNLAGESLLYPIHDILHALTQSPT
jgi:hypothetical protein